MTADNSNDDVLTAFAATRERFLSLCFDDARPEIERIGALRTTLAELLARIDLLPFRPSPSDVPYKSAYTRLRGRIGTRYPSLGFYSVVMNPLAVGSAPEYGVGDVIDDLVDIYQELFPGLELFRAGRRREAVGHWRDGFYMHWDDHAVGAIRAIHAHLQGEAWRPREAE